MAFGFQNQLQQQGFGLKSPQSNSGPQIQHGADLDEISTEALGFYALDGANKIQLTPSWPSSSLPPTTSSLLSIASNRAILAAAGPDALIVASTNTVRHSFTAQVPVNGNIKQFSPEVRISTPQRISHVAFSADEKYLVISLETSGGLGVYEVDSLMQNKSNMSFHINTNNVALRTLSPNPAPEKAELFAVVTTSGLLLMANIKERAFQSNGRVLKDNVSCVSWSTRGKQLVAGLADGTSYQVTPEGECKAIIPRPIGFDASQFVSSILWLENDIFLVAHTPSSFDVNSAPASSFHIITRAPKQQAFEFRKLPDPASPYGLNRSPPHQCFLRLKDFPPSLQDLIVVSSTASTDIGLVTRSKVPLANDVPAARIVDNFITTSMENDSRRAQMPINEEMSDTSPIGVAFDLSSKDKVPRPILNGDQEESFTPLPAFMALNNDGVLSAWWVVYSESIKQGIAYPGLKNITQPLAQPPNQSPSFGQSAFGSSTSTFGGTPKALAPAFGLPSQGAVATNSGFGTQSALGGNLSPWGSSPSNTSALRTGGASFGQPAFGSPSPMGAGAATTFGAASMLGSQSSPWISSSNTPAFGSQSNLSSGGAFGISPSTGSAGFGSYAKQGGFSSTAVNSQGSVFGKATNAYTLPSSSNEMDIGSSFGNTNTPKPEENSNFLGSGFKLVSAFKGDGTAKDDLARPASGAVQSLFGSNFGSTLDVSAKGPLTPITKDEDMETGSDTGITSTTPPAMPQPTLIFPDSPHYPINDSLNTDTQIVPRDMLLQNRQNAIQTNSINKPTPQVHSNLNASLQSSAPNAKRLTQNQTSPKLAEPLPLPDLVETTQPSQPPLLAAPLFNSSNINHKPTHSWEDDDMSANQVNLDVPLPPDSTSKTSFGPGYSTSSSSVTVKEDSQLPLEPTTISASTSGQANEPAETDISAIANDGSEGSGEDIGADISSSSDHHIGTTPQSSFGGPYDSSSLGEVFTNIAHPKPQKFSGALFGEVHSSSAPFFPAPFNKGQESPRSPSPVRSAIPRSLVRPDSLRSSSAPGGASRIKQTATFPIQSADERRKQEQLHLEEALAKQLAEEEQLLSDQEDEEMRAELLTEPDGTLVLDDFVAHKDYVGHINRDGLPGKIEMVYRDINSMIDILGINARALKAFTKGHEEHSKENIRFREDLESSSGDWCLDEIENLAILVDDLVYGLAAGSIQDPAEKVKSAISIRTELARVWAQFLETKKIIDGRNSQRFLTKLRLSPLSSEQASQQRELRNNFTYFQSKLTEVEEGISLLKAKISSHESLTGRAGARPPPTVEAILNTIQKMTGIVEKKSGDVDLLEDQMRKLGISLSREASREGTPFATPPSKRGPPLKGSALRASWQYFTPENFRSGAPRGVLQSLRGSPFSPMRGTPGRYITRISAEDADRVKGRALKKKVVIKAMKNVLDQTGPRLMTFE
ncbi:MAG: hypothetical protein M1829_000890 [Trizodia sp. TS-e1964]|nr:MAG: hypothetical protein M1829_000890 [Trizodia sp. TS-e1964]